MTELFRRGGKTTYHISMESTIQENNKRIAKNTLLLYVRMLFNMLVALYTSRVILNALGVEDFGISNVVGGLVAMFSLISSSLSSSVSRFLTVELGRGDHDKLRALFSTSVIIHLGLSVIVLLLMESIGLWFLNNQMTISTERIIAANWVFQGSVLTFIIGLLSVPYNATIISHEHMGVYAFIGILQTILRLCIAIFISYLSENYDRLIFYSILTVTVSGVSQFIYWRYCKLHFSESSVIWNYNHDCIKEMSSFAGWNFIGCTARLLKDQGVNILLNVFFSPTVNAARGIAYSVQTAIGGFSNNFMIALNPQITKSYAINDKEHSFQLSENGTRFSFYIMLLIIVPLFIESDFILKLWLKGYPDHTVSFVKLILILMLTETLANTQITLLNATGKIKEYQIAVGLLLLSNFPISYCLLFFGFSPESTMLTAIFISVFCIILRLFFLKRLTNYSPFRFIRKVVINILPITILGFTLPLFINKVLDDGWFRFIIVLLCSFSINSILIFSIGLNHHERLFIKDKINTTKKRILS